ncbi:MAG: hypothetical protein AB7D27_13190 [Desulfomicrobium sp.]
MSVDYNMLYQQLGRLLETAPDLSSYQACVQPTALHWFGRGHALVNAVYDGMNIESIAFSSAVDRMRSAAWSSGVQQVFQILYRALGHCEVHLPAGSTGTFVPVGNSFDAFKALSNIFAAATTDVMIVDPYMDHAALIEFGLAVPEGVPLRLLADTNDHKSTLHPAAQKWITQYGTSRPLSVRLAPPRSLHDRAIFIDQHEAWTITQSLKDFAKRAPAEIVRVDSIAPLKLDAYEAIWAKSLILV